MNTNFYPSIQQVGYAVAIAPTDQKSKIAIRLHVDPQRIETNAHVECKKNFTLGEWTKRMESVAEKASLL